MVTEWKGLRPMKLYCKHSKKACDKETLVMAVWFSLMGFLVTFMGFCLTQLTDTNPSDVVPSDPMPIWAGLLLALFFYAIWGALIIGINLCSEQDGKVLMHYAYGWPVMVFIAWHNGPRPAQENRTNGSTV